MVVTAAADVDATAGVGGALWYHTSMVFIIGILKNKYAVFMPLTGNRLHEL